MIDTIYILSLLALCLVVTVAFCVRMYHRIPERRADRRRDAGLCARCGYDLRGTPGRCPECGQVPEGDEEDLESETPGSGEAPGRL
jgi:hypothetical protein